jgi:hypothetical protein
MKTPVNFVFFVCWDEFVIFFVPFPPEFNSHRSLFSEVDADIQKKDLPFLDTR